MVYALAKYREPEVVGGICRVSTIHALVVVRARTTGDDREPGYQHERVH